MLSVERVELAPDWRWDAWANDTHHGDVYFTPQYSIPTALLDEGTVHLARYEGGRDEFVLYPFIKRRIDAPGVRGASGGLYDISSPYGFTGPLVKATLETFNAFRADFLAWCGKEEIVAEFTRFNPFVGNFRYHTAPTSVVSSSEIVWVPLDAPVARLWQELARANRQNIRQAERAGLRFERCLGPESLAEFVQLYWHTMRRVKAKPSYFFPKAYFHALADQLRERLCLFRVMQESETLSMALCLAFGDKLHCHLAASRSGSLPLRPNNLMFWSLILWGKEEGYSLLNLGGGISGKDSLFRFKAGFSPHRLKFHCARTILNPDLYRKLAELHRSRLHLPRRQFYRNSYFPLYRLETQA